MDKTDYARNESIDKLKGVACLGVVFIHIPFPGMIGSIVSYVCAYAVPVFYMIAGYYAYNKNENVIRRRLVKICKIAMFSFALFFLYYFGMACYINRIWEWINSIFNFETIVKLIVFCSVDFAIPLWYLIAQIETYLFWYFVVKYKKEQIMVRIMPLLFIIQVIITTICETIGASWYLKINFITRSLSWFVLGYYINSVSEKKIQYIKNRIFSNNCCLWNYIGDSTCCFTFTPKNFLRRIYPVFSSNVYFFDKRMENQERWDIQGYR
ncbi:Acyltransferase family protein [Butyrivibrio sp. ob235]|uniref:acyltransferase family protein n=1 Tax=Butyrivibrio sp. ob235 TaxID=1761780 RepID=UPI0008D0D0F5|nr:acyltransferase family protein [Butyrivibrio sp. ob235]SEL72552.1 Acyltransferase family protein [Butyrivibrio sp. ob235]